MNVTISPSKLMGEMVAQPSKSDSHRKIICAAFAYGESSIDNMVLSDDIKSTLHGVGSMGCKYEIKNSVLFPDRHELTVTGLGGYAEPVRNIDCGESGSTLRFMTMAGAAAGGKTILTGSGRLPQRPMGGALEILKAKGVEYYHPDDGRILPLEITGELSSAKYDVDSSITSQYLSGLLMALPAFSKNGVINAVGNFESKGYVDMTIKTVGEFGVTITGDNPYIIPRNKGLRACATGIEGDWSNASYYLVMNAMGANLRISGLDMETKQPDAVIIKLIENIEMNDSVEINVSECPDIMPSIAVLSAAKRAKVKITGGRRLRTKESDRIKAVSEGLANLGVETQEFNDGIEIYGTGKIGGGEVNACNDHRIAMAFSSLCVVAKGDIIIKGADSVSKSYPLFFRDLKMVGGVIS